MNPIDREKIIELIQHHYPEVIAIYLFGSYHTGDADSKSDIDIAILLPKAVDAHKHWMNMQEIGITLKQEIDLIQLNTASTVFRYIILGNSQLLYSANENERLLFEVNAISMYLQFEQERKPLIDDMIKELKK